MWIIARRPGSGGKTKITVDVKRIVEEQMRLDDETTATQLHILLTRLGYSLSVRTILRCRSILGWTFRGSAFCQLIREPNKCKRLEWVIKDKNEDFSDVLFTDESSIQQESHRQFCCRKRGEPHQSVGQGKVSQSHHVIFVCVHAFDIMYLPCTLYLEKLRYVSM